MTFMVIFYVGYCYTRYTNQLEDVQTMMHSIVDACMLCRIAFDDQREVMRVWRYLNMAHAAAYVGLSNSYSKENFFTPIIERHGLDAKESHTKAEETRALDRVNMDVDDHRA